MAKKKHVIRGCKARLRPRLASIRKKIEARVQGEVDFLKGLVARKEQELEELNDRFDSTIRNIDKGRSLKSHLQGWWRHRNA